MPGSFTEKRIDLTFQLGTGSFGGGGANQVSFQGLRVQAQIEKAGMPSPGGRATILVYGMTLSQMNQLSRAGLMWDNSNNSVLVRAGDSESGMSEVFNGQILEAYPNFDQPMAPFYVSAVPGVQVQMKPVDPTTIEGSISGEQALTQIAQKAGYTVENNGVSTQLSNPYFPGTVWDQMTRCVKALDCYAYLDTSAKKIAIWPKGQSRSGGNLLVAAETGMIGYPKFQRVMVIVRTLLDTSFKFGDKFQVKSGLTAADGTWKNNRLTYDLASQSPEGPWEMTLMGYREPQDQPGATS